MRGIFLDGLVVGLCLAAPVGPISALVLQRTTAKGKLAGVATGLGAALADAFYGSLAALGVGVVADFLSAHREGMLRAGGVILCLLGTRLLLSKRLVRGMRPNGVGLLRDFLSSLLLTLTNPMTFVAFAAVFAALGIHIASDQPRFTLELICGVFAGSAIWWFALTALAAVFRDRFRDETLLWMNRAVGGFVIVVGVFYLTGLAASLVAPPPVPLRP